MKIAVLLLCHEAPATLADYLASPFFRHPDVKVYLHHDASRGARALAGVRAAVPAGVACEVLDDRVAVAWGEYSLVEATRRLMAAALADEAFRADHLLLASASCHPIRPVASLQRFLAARPGIEFIQAHDIALGRWVTGGLEEERFRWYFPFNYATRRSAFEFATRWQRRLGVRRAVPPGLRIHFGSQWFCLTRDTAAAVARELLRPELARFIRWSWIPDEFAIQTLVAATCPPARIAGHGLTYYEFDRQGRPLMLDEGHLAHVLSQPFFFARKVAPEARGLVEGLREACRAPAAAAPDEPWFDRAGQATADYQRFLVRAEVDPSARSHVGAFLPQDGAALAASRRRYYVLHGASRGHLLTLLRRVRELAHVPAFDFPFDRSGLALAAERHTWYGLRPEDRPRAAYEPLSFLRELVHVDPVHPAAFAIDVGMDHPVVDFVSRDPRAVLVDCTPPDATRECRAAAALQHVVGRNDAWVLEPTMRALRDGLPLPQDRWRTAGTARAPAPPGAMRTTLAGLATWPRDATSAALVAAADDLPADAWYPGRAAAELLVAGAIGPRPRDDSPEGSA